MTPAASPTRAHLLLQGFACDANPAILASSRWLRFTPALSTVAIVGGTLLRSPAVLLAFTACAAIGAAGWHPFDALFNHVVRHVVGAEPLPPNPAPRRFAMAVASVWAAGTAWLYSAGFATAGLVAGLALGVAAVLVSTTHFCIGSLIYRMIWGPRGA
jgi:hypothetical protein